MQSPKEEGDADDSHDDHHPQAKSREEIQDVVDSERGIGIERCARIGTHADSRVAAAPAEGLPGALMSEARNDQAIREKSPDFSTYGSAISPSKKTTGVKGVPLELAGAVAASVRRT